MSFQVFGLLPQILNNLEEKGYVKPTPIQLGVIPLAFKGKDILAAAQTGTGKTAAFALPILQRLTQTLIVENFRNPKALILAPTRELAMQISINIEAYGKDLGLKFAAIYGGANIKPQSKKLAAGTDIIIATPGRVLEHVKLNNIHLSQIEYLVLDEADSMLDMGFIREIENILELLPKKRQTMLFSATLSSVVKRLSQTMLIKPQLVQVDDYASITSDIKQIAYCVSKEQKSELLSFLISSKNWKQTLIFCRTKLEAQEIANDFKDRGLSSESIHANKTHGARSRALSAFKEGKVRVLVATDLAARGLDISDLPFVVNYDVPNIATDYIHRIGRTGRAGNVGEAITLLSSLEVKSFKKIEELLGYSITKITVDGYADPKILDIQKSKIKTSVKKKEQNKKTPGAFGRKKEIAPKRGKRASNKPKEQQ